MIGIATAHQSRTAPWIFYASNDMNKLMCRIQIIRDPMPISPALNRGARRWVAGNKRRYVSMIMRQPSSSISVELERPLVPTRRPMETAAPMENRWGDFPQPLGKRERG